MLLIDAGNSRVKCRLIQKGVSSDQQFQLVGDSGAGISAFNQYLSNLNVKGIYLASVAEDHVTQQVVDSIQQFRPSVPMRRLYTQPHLGKVKNAYIDHTLLGVDRWLTLLAASDLVAQDVIIIDAGSAITVDLLSRDSGHLGGAILAGLNTSELRFREIFSRLDFSHPDIRQIEKPGRSTLQCIHLTNGMDVIDYTVQLIERWSKLLRAPVRILLCGQDARQLQSKFNHQDQVVPDLVFRGMLKQIELQG